jgi:predicted ATPase
MFLYQLLQRLQDDNLLTYNFLNMKWQWDMENLQRHILLSDNVVELVCARIMRLDAETQNVLKLASCFGVWLDIEVLELTKSLFHVKLLSKGLEESCRKE